MHIIQFSLVQHLWSWRVLYLLSALLAQPVAATNIALGTSYSTFDNLIIVRASANAIQNCTNLRDAIANTSGVRTIKLPPATYDCALSALTIPNGVTLEGSGQQNTRIIGQVSSFSASYAVNLLSGSELYNLTVENTGTGATTGFAVNGAIDARSGSVINHVTIISQGVNRENQGILLSGDSPPGVVMNHVIIRVNNGVSFNQGISASGTVTATLSDVDILALDAMGSSNSYGILVADSSFLTIKSSVLNGATGAISGAFEDAPALSIANSQVSNGVDGEVTYTCFGAYDEDLEALSNTCTGIP